MDNKRFSQRNKERKMNRVYNVLIVVVAVLIVFIGGQMMFGKSDGEKATKEPASEQKQQETNEESAESNEDNNNDKDKNEEQEENVEDESDEENEMTEEAGEAEVQENPEAGVNRRIVDPSWEPVGTQQSEPHAATYEKGSVDWNEMLQAVSYGSGVPVEDMTIWRIGNNGSPQKAVATISSKSENKKYRVQIDWVESEGWKPVVVDELAQ
ncbi:YrrS family protein [Metabacillus iocasae]|uniref:Cytoskeletal protein RodZ n=1 Tax=Priestia iocasae TaxID=2291674 RepID=A0ABS2QPR2_9BACI|nr:YrrS family protein [Metabacillus iocasae]MBM7701432.1 cytoskeletal protein RodZ [Metabacillus iocasae]